MRFVCCLLVAGIAPYSALRLRDDSIRADIELDDPYAFRHLDNWKKLNFESKWEVFRRVIPLQKLQANRHTSGEQSEEVQCEPTLIGPENSDKLAILQHGFLSCPGLWWRLIPRLLGEGFRVMLPTLPGHGRVWRLPVGAINSTFVDLTSPGPTTNVTDVELDVSDAQDDLEDMPTDGKPYESFAETLGHLAIQFRKEHPDGIIAVAGHSLGGAVTARYAMDLPEVVDRVMLINPFFALASGWLNLIYSISRLWPNMLMSKGSSCESQRGKGSGGTCQFRIIHVEAMREFAHSMLCHHWGILNKACMKEKDNDVRSFQNLGLMRHMQVVTTNGEPLVDNGQISNFVLAVQQQHSLHRGARRNKKKKGSADYDHMYCEWPSEFGHAYLSNRDSGKWWHPYVERVTAMFLATGKNVDIVNVGQKDKCLENSADVEGEHLTLLPAVQTLLQSVQHADTYGIGTPDGLVSAKIMFRGYARKESHRWRMRKCFIEILFYRGNSLIVTRHHENHNVRNIYLMTDNFIELLTKEKSCAKLSLVDVSVGVPLDGAVATATAASRHGRSLHFCGRRFVRELCRMLSCNGDSFNEKIEQALSVMTGQGKGLEMDVPIYGE